MTTVLLVDDEKLIQRSLEKTLLRAGYDVLTAPDCKTGSEVFAQNAAAVDIAVLDLNMPGMNGIEACRQIKTLPNCHDIPIIMVTSSDEMDDLKHAFAAGAMDYLTKPPNEVELLARLRSALRLKQETDRRKAREQELKRLNGRLEQVLTNLAEQHHMLQLEQEKSERLLLNILPSSVAQQLKQSPGVIAERFEEVTVLFADIVDFTPLSASIPPEELVNLLNDIFSLFDHLAEKHGLEKIKTIGDAYMAVGGLPMPMENHATAVANMALDIQCEMNRLFNGRLQVRIGLHTGPVVAGVIGKKKFIYDLWGDTVNTASRMESHGLTGNVQVTEATYHHLKDHYLLEKRGTIQVKGKGNVVTYLLLGHRRDFVNDRAPTFLG
ncbi:MAG: adenylate/guanylate cyclase domain-containing response regulator [Chloroflexi bacterium]|nr:MAG: adenylate/guanylate cyclase domain-containing response regulator [Chloroflexota bacterium]